MEDSLTATAYVLAPDATKQKIIAAEVRLGLETNTIKLSAVILSMQDLLFSNDAKQRETAMSYLAAILEQVNRDALSRADVSLLVQFIEARYSLDPAGFKENSKALRYLSAMKRFDPKASAEIVSKVYNAVEEKFSGSDIPAVSARFEVYKLLDELLNRHRSVIRGMGADFINIITDLCSNERDPRNLMLIFSMVEVILAEWDPVDTAQGADELYELLSRYFPISFRPKPGDPINISGDDLIMRLRNCFAAYSGFADSLFPNLIQRLDDPNRLNAKADVLLTMKACIEHYEPVIVAQWSIRLWDALKYEIFNSSDDSQAPNALKVLRAIASRLSIGCTIQTLSGTSLQVYVDMVIKECISRFQENSQKFGNNAGQIIAAVSTGSPLAYHLAIRGSLPALLSEFDKADATLAEKRAVIEVINQLLDARFEILRIQWEWEFPAISIIDGISFDADKALADGEDVGVASEGLLSYRDRLTSVFMGVARDVASGEKLYRIAALQGLAKLLRLPQFLERLDVDLYIQYFSTVVLETSDLDNPVRKEAIHALQDSVSMYSTDTVNSAFPTLLGTLPDIMPSQENKPEYLAILASLGDIASRGPLMETLLRRLISKLDVVIRSNTTQEYGHLILAGILYALEQREKQTDIDEWKHRDAQPYRNLVDELLQRVAALKAHGSKWYIGLRDMKTAAGNAQPDDKLVELIGRVVMTAVRSMSLDDQQWIAIEKFSLFVKYDGVTAASVAAGDNEAPRDLRSFADNASNNKRDDDDTVVQVWARRDIAASQFDLQGAPADQQRALIITKYIMAGLRRGDSFMIDDRQAASSIIELLTQFDDSPTVRSSLLDLLALLVNKYGSLKENQKLTDVNPLQALISGLSVDIASKAPKTIKNIVQIICALTQAANLAMEPMAQKLIQQVLDGLEIKGVAGQLFAQAFNPILGPSPLLIAKNHAITRALSKQRLFSTCVPVIVQKFAETSDQELRANYLVALGGILRNVPGDMIMPHIDVLLPLLLQSIESGSDAAKAASIDVVRIAAVESPSAVEAHIAGILRRLLACIEHTDNKLSRCSPDTRVKALECLKVLPGCLRLQVILPHKRVVMAALGQAVNDTSRLVRMSAVDCQAVWWRLASASEDED